MPPTATRRPYANLLHVNGAGISDTGHARRIAHAREENRTIVLDQWGDDLENGGEPRSLSWVVRIIGSDVSALIGVDRGVDDLARPAPYPTQ